MSRNDKKEFEAFHRRAANEPNKSLDRVKEKLQCFFEHEMSEKIA